jgi:hypothetical protein
MVTCIARDKDGRFEGERCDVEGVPRLPTFPARWALEDPRGRPYFVFWSGQGGSLAYRLRLRPEKCGSAVTISDPEGRVLRVGLVRRQLPRRGGVAILYRCPSCGTPRRYLYGLALIDNTLVHDGLWRCRVCAGLTFASQGRYRNRWERLSFAAVYGETPAREPLPRHPWDPRAVSDPRMVVDEFPGQLVQRVPH